MGPLSRQHDQQDANILEGFHLIDDHWWKTETTQISKIPSWLKKNELVSRMLVSPSDQKSKNSPVKWLWGNCVVELEVHINEPTSVPDVTDLSGTSRGALPPPARAAAFELLLAVMVVSTPSAHLMNKHGGENREKLQRWTHFSKKKKIWTHTVNLDCLAWTMSATHKC